MNCYVLVFFNGAHGNNSQNVKNNAKTKEQLEAKTTFT